MSPPPLPQSTRTSLEIFLKIIAYYDILQLNRGMKSESPLRRNIIIFVFVAAIFAAPLPSLGETKGAANGNAFPLDQTLMGFKEQGVWYFLCIAPEYPIRIGPQYATYGPPPPPCPPPLCLAPVKPPKSRKIHTAPYR